MFTRILYYVSRCHSISNRCLIKIDQDITENKLLWERINYSQEVIDKQKLKTKNKLDKLKTKKKIIIRLHRYRGIYSIREISIQK